MMSGEGMVPVGERRDDEDGGFHDIWTDGNRSGDWEVSWEGGRLLGSEEAGEG